MEKIELIYNFTVLAMSTLIFIMKFTSPNIFIDLILKATGKIIPLFMIGYAMVKIFKYYEIII